MRGARRFVLPAAALCGAALVLVAACGASSGRSPAAQLQSGTAAAPPAAPRRTAVQLRLPFLIQGYDAPLVRRGGRGVGEE